MKTYLTEYRSCETFERYAGENIRASSWKEAEAIAEAFWVEVIGELIETIHISEEDYFE